MEKYFLRAVLVLILILLPIEGKTNPQLDLPPLTTPSTHPDIYFNSYTPSQVQRNQNPYSGDDDRSNRGGPPYGAVENDRNDYDNVRQRNNDDPDRYRYRNNQYNRTDQSPFSGGSVDYDRNRYNGDRFNQNNRPYDPRDQPREFDRSNRFDQNSRPYDPQNNYNQNSRPYNQPPFDRPQNFDGFNRERDDRFNDDRYRLEQDRRYRIQMEKLRNFLTETDHKSSLECTANVASQWNFETNVNEVTQAEALLGQQRYSEYQSIVHEQAKNFDQNLVFEPTLFRQLNLISQTGPNSLPPDQLDRYNRLINEMLALSNQATICAFEAPFHCGLRLNPELKEIMARSRDWDELQHTWQEYRRKSGREMRDSYEQLIDVVNEIAYANNFTNGGEYWYSAYDSPSFREDVEVVWQEIRPLYDMIHAYTRRKLREYYGPDKIHRNAPIPAHILGNMFGQTWTNILDLIIPYPGRNFIDVTPKMLEQGYTPAIMFQLAEEFFTSINMSALAPDFWIKSVIEEIPGQVILCQPSAWDFCNRHDFRVKMCTKITQKDFVTVHQEMAHVQYFLHYRHQPKVFRDGANPGFHQAIGDAIGLSISTPKHLQTLGLVQKSVDETSYDINYLFGMAVDKVVFLPYALAMDNWRYDLFSGRARKHMMNCHYWDLREQYGGIKPPVLRSEMDFDPGAKYHIPGNVPYIKYFVSTVLQFQIYRSMCRASNQYIPGDPRRPLHKCDIYRQPVAGNLLKRIMEKGASQLWQQTLSEVIGEDRLDGSAIREYFAPLEEWLRLENLRNQESVGWNYDGDYCKRSIETANLQVSGGYYNAACSNHFRLNIFGVVLIILLPILIVSTNF